MEWLLPDSHGKAEGLEYIHHWLNTVAAFCKSTKIFLVGTHKDTVSMPSDHAAIHNLLQEGFQKMPIWRHVTDLKEVERVLCFFPVDNTRGLHDSVIPKLMRQIEEAGNQSKLFLHKIPFAWMTLMDKVEELKQERRHFISLEEFTRECRDAGFPSRQTLDLNTEVSSSLEFLDKLGLILHNPTAPYLVILRPS